MRYVIPPGTVVRYRMHESKLWPMIISTYPETRTMREWSVQIGEDDKVTIGYSHARPPEKPAYVCITHKTPIKAHTLDCEIHAWYVKVADCIEIPTN